MTLQGLYTFLHNISSEIKIDVYDENFKVRRIDGTHLIFEINIDQGISSGTSWNYQPHNSLKLRVEFERLGKPTVNDNRAISNQSPKKYLIKSYKNLSFLKERFFIREYVLSKYFEEKALLFGKSFKGSQLYKSNSCFLREFIGGNYKPFSTLNKETLILLGKKLADFHSIEIKSNDLLGYFVKNELKKNPFRICRVEKLSEHKDSSLGLYEFWKIANEIKYKKILENAIEKVIDKRKNYLIHGDFRKANILFDSSNLVFIDFENWHFGNPLWDIASFFRDAHKEITNSKHLTYFLDSYNRFNDLGYTEEDVKNAMLLLNLQVIKHELDNIDPGKQMLNRISDLKENFKNHG